jgi:hypothetical protein
MTVLSEGSVGWIQMAVSSAASVALGTGVVSATAGTVTSAAWAT